MASRHISRRGLLQGAAVAAGLGLVGCSGGVGTGGSRSGQLKFWNGFFATSSADQKSKKPSDFWIGQAVSRFEKASGVKVKMGVLPGSPEMFTRLRAAGVARNGPDLASIWSGSYTFGIKSVLAKLDPYFGKAEQRRGIRGWSATTEGFVEGKGTIYGVPVGMDGVSALFADRRKLRKAGVELDPDQILEWDEWMDLLERVKRSGTTPLALGNYDYTVFSLSYWIAQVVGGTRGLQELGSGKRKFASPEVAGVLGKWRKLADYALPGTATMETDDAIGRIVSGKAAILLSGGTNATSMRDALDDDAVMVKQPNISKDAAVRDTGIGGPGGALVVSSYAKDKDEAVELVKHLVQPEEQERRARAGESVYPNVAGLDPAELYKDPLDRKQYEWANQDIVYYSDNVWPTALVDEYLAQAQLAWTGKIDTDEMLQRLDGKRDELADRQPGS